MQPVIFNTISSVSGNKIGVATLNVEHALNALNLEMIDLLIAQLTRWQQDDDIACVILDGAGNKAFCAGGDVRALYQACIQATDQIPPKAFEFFTKEYRLDCAIHRFTKPFIVWGNGLVMGGGVGLLMGASHRIVTENAKIAMPEVSIGLYPDVGGSYFLNRMPNKLGLFLGLTGYILSPADALYSGMANYFIEAQNKQKFIDKLTQANWQQENQLNYALVTEVIAEVNQQTEPATESYLQQNQLLISQLMDGSLEDIIDRMTAFDTQDKCLARAQKTFLAGSPLSWYLIYQQSLIGKSLDLASCFCVELGWSLNCCTFGDFAEGVRALLIDKDKSPNWQYKSLSEIPQAIKDKMITSPWAAHRHPLKDL